MAKVANRMICTVAPLAYLFRVIIAFLQTKVLRVPKGTRNPIAVSHARRLQQRGRPSPRGDNGRSDETGLDRSSRSAEHFRGLHFILVSL